MTPFEEFYGKPPMSMILYLLILSKVQEVDNNLTSHADIVCILKDNLVLAQNHMKRWAKQHHSKCLIDEGDQVFLHIQPYK